jgi:hypothetical protein
VIGAVVGRTARPSDRRPLRRQSADEGGGLFYPCNNPSPPDGFFAGQ